MPNFLQVEDVRGRVHYGIITIREDEFKAVLDRLPERATVKGRKQFYEFARIPFEGGSERRVAVVRCPSQGQTIAQSVTGQMIRELQPHVLLLVGISGGIPSDDFSLGDVLLANRVHDFSITAALQGGESQLNVGGGPVHESVEKLLAHLPAFLRRMPDWNTEREIGRPRPSVTIPIDINSADLSGDDAWKSKVIDSLRRHFTPADQSRLPLASVGPTASSNQLVKDASLVLQWQEAARSFTNIEMELAGVLQAARDADGGEVPVIAIRGLSDIVGFRRDADWTGYACHSAASLCLGMIKSKVIEEATDWNWETPRLLHGKMAVVSEWLAGAATEPAPTELSAPAASPTEPLDSEADSVPAPAILILGPGGVGKTTLGKFLSGNEDRSPLAAPQVYNESASVETYLRMGDNGTEAMVLVPPGQEHRRVRDWETLYDDLRNGRFRGIIFLAAYGYHTLGLISWKEHALAKSMKRKTPAAFLRVYLERQRQEELSVFSEMSTHIRACKSKLWMLTLVGKEDLWYGQGNGQVHYRDGAYGALVKELEDAKRGEEFKHELVFASLVINNFTSSVGETLAENQAGYDHNRQVGSLRHLVEVFDSLRRWERGE